MLLPKKITPDSIREAVVEIRYISNISPEVLIGMFYQAFDKTWYYTNRPLQQPAVPSNVVQEMTIKIGSDSFLFNDKISIRLLPNSFVFTCLNNKYIGWEQYEAEITKALKIFDSTKRIKHWTRVGFRYISEYPHKDLRDCFNFSFTFGLPDVQSQSTAFRSEFEYKNSKVILNLNNKVPVMVQNPSTKQSQIIPTSITDIDVITGNLKLTTIDELLNVIRDCHTKEKELYFGIIKDDFLKSLNPQY
jgi:uncharacterized protein (TIGR04255 family)